MDLEVYVFELPVIDTSFRFIAQPINCKPQLCPELFKRTHSLMMRSADPDDSLEEFLKRKYEKRFGKKINSVRLIPAELSLKEAT